jgi:chromosome segregation ATPase
LSSFADHERAIADQVNRIEHEEHLRELSAQLEVARARHKTIADQFDALSEERGRLIASLDEVIQSEQKLELDEEALTKKIGTAPTIAEERTLAVTRFELERKRHEIEETRWDLEDKVQSMVTAIANTETLLDEEAKKLSAVEGAITKEQKSFPSEGVSVSPHVS